MRFLVLLLLAVALPQQVFSQTYPSKPIRIVVPFPPGGGTDVGTRVIAQKLQESLGQPVLVENKGGAAGILGTEYTAKAAPDGYTIMMGNIGTHAINVSLYKSLSYDPVKDFAPISQVAGLPMLLLVHPSVKANTVAELIALAKANPGTLNYSSSGAGGMPHVSGALFASMTGIQMVHVPYKGGGPAVADLIAGHVSLSFATALESLPQVKGGKLRALAVSSARRSVAAPELPTIADTVPGYESGSWLALYAPAGTPKEIIVKLSAETVRIVNLPDVRERLLQQGAEPIGSTPEQLAATQLADTAKYAKVIRESGFKPE